MSTLAITGAGGELLPARLELREASGPVSPRFHYQTFVLVTCDPSAAGPTLTVEHTAHTHGPSPRCCTVPLERDRYERLWADLLAQDALGLGGDLTAGRRRRVGVSFNHVEITLGAAPDAAARMRFDYLLPQLRLAAHQQRRAVVELLKALVLLCP